ncbi:MAG: sulfide/dihydroorotate dehydrogenase-like FAD/NAD-binding protein, partial [Clostridiales bacterium]|nr:sulfide/dihydroorotate dehydrogenase-like FAD/NAD-binding protein [Clostridiales bacterium]
NACDNFYLMTDDGSYGEKGFTTTKEQQLLEAGKKYDVIIAIGPVPMMKFVVKTAEPFGVPCRVSLNPIMIDGTGMCGGCRVSVGGKMKFACVDGPEFDGYQVDFDELMNRNGTYRDQEAQMVKDHMCRFEKLGKDLIQ